MMYTEANAFLYKKYYLDLNQLDTEHFTMR